MVTKPDSVPSQNLTSIEIQLGVMALSAMTQMLLDTNQPSIQFHALRELFLAKEHFAFAHDLSALLHELENPEQSNQLTILTNKLFDLLDAKP